MRAPRAGHRAPLSLIAAILLFAVAADMRAGEWRAPQEAADAPQTPREAAPVDLTGTWVSIVTEDWRWRMVTPPKGDTASVPLNEEGRRVAEAWDPSEAGSCKAYGAAGLMRIPGRVRISWEGSHTLTLETDSGQQVRRLHFDGADAPRGAPSLQGHSVAEWERGSAGAGGFDGLGRGGSRATTLEWLPLKVVTANLLPGWLRLNGVPYSANAVVTERFIRYSLPDGSEWLTIMTIVDDPTYLTEPFLTSTNFRREPDDSRWNPSPCRS